MYLSKGIKVLSAVLLLTTIAVIDLGEFATARPSPRTKTTQVARRRLGFRVGVRSSNYRVGGFSRSASCNNNEQKLIALVPPSETQEASIDQNQKNVNRNQKDPVDKTVSDRPTLFFYAPFTTANSAQFTLQNEAGSDQLYTIKFKLTGKPGIVGISLPQSGPALQVGQKYVWQVSVNCGSSASAIVSTWIERVKPSADGQITTLAEQGIWQDVVSALALSRFQKAQDRTAAEDWATLMEDAKLPEFKQTEIVQIVKN